MLQLGFGLDPFQSGMITFVSAAGAIAMKFAVQPIFAAFGFKRVLLAGALVSAIFIAAIAAINEDTPVYWLYGLLLTIGFTRSLYFTGLNALSFSEMRPENMAQATAVNATFQQLSVAAGVAMAGAMLEGYAAANNGLLSHSAYVIAFLAVGFVSALAAIPFLRMDPSAGSEVSGHSREKPNEPLP